MEKHHGSKPAKCEAVKLGREYPLGIWYANLIWEILGPTHFGTFGLSGPKLEIFKILKSSKIMKIKKIQNFLKISENKWSSLA